MIIDASVLLRIALPAQRDRRALAVLRQPFLQAPPNLRSEVGHVLSKRVRARQLARHEAEAIWADIDGLPVEIVPSPSWATAMRLCLDLNVVFNDACYLALALERNDRLVTADERLLRAVEKSREVARSVLKLDDL